MSTRCNVHVIQQGLDWEEKVQLYHHCDGYPTNMLPLFAKAFEQYGKGWEAGRAGKVAGMIIATDVGQFEPESDTKLHGDIEYFYLIEVRNSAECSMADKPSWFVTVFAPKEGFWNNSDLEHLGKLAGPLEVVKAAKQAERIEKQS